MFEDLLRDWDGEEVAIRHDRASGAWMFVCVDSTVLGPAMGGTRMKVYETPDDALADCLRLSGAMTLKQAAAGLPFGGGKAVLAVRSVPDPGSAKRRDLLLRHAAFVDALGGTYLTAADMNIDASDMDVMGERTSYVLGRSPGNGGAGDPAAGTAVGVFHGIVSSVARRFSTTDLAGRTVLVQGVGAVGSRLAALLHEAGVSLILADTHDERARSAADRFGAKVVGPDDVIETECDVYSPCATGGFLNDETVPRLRCAVVAGSANNQLATPKDGERLSDAGILYAPDFVINAGGVIHLAGYETLGWDEATMAARLAGIGETLTEVFEAAERQGITTDAAAQQVARARIDAAIVDR